MFKDEVKVKFAAGRGGNGRIKIVDGKRPIGGNGGDGGDVYLEGSKNISNLEYIDEDTVFQAEDGQLGGINDHKGKSGAHMVLKVPLGTEVYALNGNLILKIDEDGEKKLLLKGGIGGLGNYHFRDGQFENLKKATTGTKGKDVNARLVFKLKADIVFIGLPNAGKSSMLNSLTNAHAKVGNYPFTTISPNLGTLPGLKLMDLPGLIEGTNEGKGLGSSFLKHTEKATLIAHFLSLESDDVLRDYKIIRKELEQISKDLAQKKEIIVLNKVDMVDDETIERQVKSLEETGKRVVLASAFYPDKVAELEKVFREEIKE